MRTLALRLWMSACRFRRPSDGVAAVEFALILPVMLLAYIGTMEASALISMDRRVQTVTGTVGDLVARLDGEIPLSALTNYFEAADGIMQPYSTDGLQQVVSSVYVDPEGETEVQWSQAYHGGTPHEEGTPYVLPDAMIAIARDAYVIVSEASYSYTPLLGIVYEHPIDLYRENFFMPRFGGAIAIDLTK